MSTTLIILKFICLFFSVLYTLVFIGRLVAWKEGITPIQNILHALGVTGFIILQWLI